MPAERMAVVRPADMTEQPTAAVILTAGLGTRMKSRVPKVVHPLAGRPMLAYLLDTVNAIAPARTVVVIGGPGSEAVAELAAPAEIVVQREPRGTADAVRAARGTLADFDGDVLVLFGADPLVPAATLRALLAARRGPEAPALVVLGMRPDDPGLYGRLIVGRDGALERIVEARDASPAERAVELCNAGLMVADGRVLFELLEDIGCDNAKNEYYLTDAVALARARGLRCGVVEGAARELLGVDTRADLAAAEALVQERLREAAMAAGVSLIDPRTVYLSYDTRFGTDVVVEPNVVFGPGVCVGSEARIRAFSHVEGASIADGAVVGPFARLRPGAHVGAAARVGNFVEVKAAVIEAGAKVNHLSYVGDARVGERANVGAGTITCNYDGFAKARTEIGAKAFIGSNTALVAPVAVGARAVIGAGSVITRDVPDDALAITRASQVVREGAAARLRARKHTARERRERDKTERKD